VQVRHGSALVLHHRAPNVVDLAEVILVLHESHLAHVIEEGDVADGLDLSV